MMNNLDVHFQFASFFPEPRLRPYAYLLSKKMQEGHICIHEADVQAQLKDTPFEEAELKTPLSSLSKFVASGENQILPFVVYNQRLYLQRYFNYETQILNRIKGFIAAEDSCQQERLQALKTQQGILEKFQADYSLDALPDEEKVDWQMVAVVQSVLHYFSIVTGGPGTGKTTTVAKILSVLLHLDPACKIALCAPTGKAAMRMAESLKNTNLPVDDSIKTVLKNLSPNTIHRLLRYVPESINFKHNRDNPLPYDVLVVDEASMLDVALFAKLMEAVGPNTRIILLGDKNQLASVEAGSLFGDLCRAQDSNLLFSDISIQSINSFIPDKERQLKPRHIGESDHPLFAHVVELQKSHRFSSSSGIGKLSRAIIQNDEVALKEFIETPYAGIGLIDQKDQNGFEAFIAGYADYIKEPDVAKALDKFNQLRVLCAVREGVQGLYSLNKAIETYLSKKNLINPNNDYYENRPIIITKNYPDLKLFNGDVGIVRKDDAGNMRAWFEDSEKNIRSVMPGYIAHAETVFAMTIHKSQGSEYPKVLVVLPEASGTQLLTRELLYTAVTRAKESLVLQCSAAVMRSTCAQGVSRTSGIVERLKEN
jgi:exodeoxyribonuclease V alpha subunit